MKIHVNTLDFFLKTDENHRLGRIIRKRRLELNLYQGDVGLALGVSAECIKNWELGHSIPQLRYLPAITDFLGYCPIEFDVTTQSGRLKQFRYSFGLSRHRLAEVIGIDEYGVKMWEDSSRNSTEGYQVYIDLILATV